MADDGRLFDIKPETAEHAVDDAHHQRHGVAAEHAAIALLLERGHIIHVPVTDDDGVDFIVDYRTCVQVKSSAHRDQSGALRVNLENHRARERQHSSHGLKDHVDVLLAYARDIGTWYVVPRGDVPHSQALLIGHRHERWREAWHVFVDNQ
jgi:hypothetical protein